MSWFWNTKFIGWLERQLIDVTTTIYIKRRGVYAQDTQPVPRTQPRKSTKIPSRSKSKRV